MGGDRRGEGGFRGGDKEGEIGNDGRMCMCS